MDRGVRIRPVPGALLLLWCAAVWLLSDRADPTDVLVLPLDLPDWSLHFVEYALGGLLAVLAVRAGEVGDDVLLALGFCALYALLDEWHQGFVPGRDASGTDVAADVLGAGVGVLLGAVLGRARRERALTRESGRPTADE